MSPSLAVLLVISLLLAGCSLAAGSKQPASDPTGVLGPAQPRAARVAEILEDLPRGEVLPPPVVHGDRRLALVLLEQGRAELDSGRRIAALEQFVRAVNAASDLPEAWEHVARTLRTLGRSEQALASFRQALRLDPYGLGARVGLARTLERLGRRTEAIDRWQDVLALDPAHGAAHARLAVGYHYLGDRDAALRHLEAAEAQGGAVPVALRPILESGGPPRAMTRGPTHSIERGSAGIVVGPRVRVDAGSGTSHSAETSVVASDGGSRGAGSSAEVVAAWNDLRDGGGVGAWSLGVGVSLDGGETWTDFLLRPPGAPVTSYEADPMTAYDPRTGFMWAGAITFGSPGNIYVARKAPGAAVFDPVVFVHQENLLDKGWMAAGPAPGDPSATRLYVTYNLGLQASADLGATWSGILPLDFGVGYLPRVGPGGELYIAYWDFEDGVMLQRSLDGGATVSDPITIAQRLDFWDAQDGSRFPGRFRAAALTYLAVDPIDGVLYCVYFDTTEVVEGQANVDTYFTRSSDQGDTWEVPRVIHGDSSPPGDQFFPWLEVDTDGRLHLMFFDTRNTPQLDDVEAGFVDVYYATSSDRGDSWTEVRLTPVSFTSAGTEDFGFEQFLGDFVGLAVAGDKVVAVYPATVNGDLDIFARSIELNGSIFADGFESGDTSAWMP
ncbi:MAG: hypothetical protein GY719_10160 [bacterium]|nr:hypothetical protein [bacterium]